MSELDVIQGFFKKEQKDKIDKYLSLIHIQMCIRDRIEVAQEMENEAGFRFSKLTIEGVESDG